MYLVVARKRGRPDPVKRAVTDARAEFDAKAEVDAKSKLDGAGPRVPELLTS